jgi:hypothetical protein
MRRLPIILLPMIVAACAQPARQPPAAAAPPPAPGLVQVMGRSAEAVVAVLGRPTLDRTEGQGRHLQFANAQCVLDLFLYPPAAGTPQGGGAIPRPAVVTHVEARQPTGRRMEAQACLAAQLASRPIG